MDRQLSGNGIRHVHHVIYPQLLGCDFAVTAQDRVRELPDVRSRMFDTEGMVTERPRGHSIRAVIASGWGCAPGNRRLFPIGSP